MSELAQKARLGRLDALSARETLNRNLFERPKLFGGRSRKPGAPKQAAETPASTTMAA